jgi:hypothetical protein
VPTPQIVRIQAARCPSLLTDACSLQEQLLTNVDNNQRHTTDICVSAMLALVDVPTLSLLSHILCLVCYVPFSPRYPRHYVLTFDTRNCPVQIPRTGRHHSLATIHSEGVVPFAPPSHRPALCIRIHPRCRAPWGSCLRGDPIIVPMKSL